MSIRNSESDASKPRRGRRPRPGRCVIQLRQRIQGKVISIMSLTVDCPVQVAMKRLQEAFAEEVRKFSRATDNPLW